MAVAQVLHWQSQHVTMGDHPYPPLDLLNGSSLSLHEHPPHETYYHQSDLAITGPSPSISSSLLARRRGARIDPLPPSSSALTASRPPSTKPAPLFDQLRLSPYHPNADDGEQQPSPAWLTPNGGASEQNGSDSPTSPTTTNPLYDQFSVKHRRRTSAAQLKVLEWHFGNNPKPEVSLRKSLAEDLGMTPREVQVWFQNRRAKAKKLANKTSEPSLAVAQHAQSEQEQRSEWYGSEWEQAPPAACAFGTQHPSPPQLSPIVDSTLSAFAFPPAAGTAGSPSPNSAHALTPTGLPADEMATPIDVPSSFVAASGPPSASTHSACSYDSTSAASLPSLDLDCFTPTTLGTPSSATSSHHPFHFGGAGGVAPLSVAYPPGFDPDVRRASCPAEFIDSFQHLGMPSPSGGGGGVAPQPATTTAGPGWNRTLAQQHPPSSQPIANFPPVPSASASAVRLQDLAAIQRGYLTQRRHSVAAAPYLHQQQQHEHMHPQQHQFAPQHQHHHQGMFAESPTQLLGAPQFTREAAYRRRSSCAGLLDPIAEMPSYLLGDPPSHHSVVSSLDLELEGDEEASQLHLSSPSNASLRRPALARRARSQTNMRNLYGNAAFGRRRGAFSDDGQQQLQGRDALDGDAGEGGEIGVDDMAPPPPFHVDSMPLTEQSSLDSFFVG